MITIKTDKDIALMRIGGKTLSHVLKALVASARPGVSALELDSLAEKLVREAGDVPSFLHYKARGSDQPYPSSLCLSINDDVVHGPANRADKVLKEGDIASLDMGLSHKGLFLDSAVTVGVGVIDAKAKRLLDITRESLAIGIAEARAGNHVGDIGHAIEAFIKKHGYGIVRDLAGHGVGYAVHEEPYVPNYGKKGTGPVLKAGMVIAIEPMINEGGDEVKIDTDGMTFKTADGSRSAHFEHTVLITAGEPEVLTA